MVARKNMFPTQIKPLALVITKITGLGLSLNKSPGYECLPPGTPHPFRRLKPLSSWCFLMITQSTRARKDREGRPGPASRSAWKQSVVGLAGSQPAVLQRGFFTDLIKMTT